RPARALSPHSQHAALPILRRATTLKRTLGRMKNQYPLLAELMEEVEECGDLQDSIASAIDDNGEIKDSASAKLAVIRRDMQISLDRKSTRLNSSHVTSSYA